MLCPISAMIFLCCEVRDDIVGHNHTIRSLTVGRSQVQVNWEGSARRRSGIKYWSGTLDSFALICVAAAS